MRIYAVFDVLFTGLNNVAVYQNGQISGMLTRHPTYYKNFRGNDLKGAISHLSSTEFFPLDPSLGFEVSSSKPVWRPDAKVLTG